MLDWSSLIELWGAFEFVRNDCVFVPSSTCHPRRDEVSYWDQVGFCFYFKAASCNTQITNFNINRRYSIVPLTGVVDLLKPYLCY